MTVADYLSKLGWDANKWTVLKEEEWQPLMKVSGYQNNMFDAVKDPDGRKEYGKNARIVERNWMNKNLASVTTADLAEAPATPLPPVPKVPEKLQEIADASPNVVIASLIPPVPEVPKEPTVPPVPKEAVVEEKKELEWPSFVKTRAANLIAKGWTLHPNDKEILMPPSGEDKALAYEDLEVMEDEEWMATLKRYNPKKEETPTEDPAIEKIKAAQQKAKDDREKVEAEVQKNKEKAEREESIKRRIAFLVNNGCEAIEPDGTPAILTPDGHIFTGVELVEMESDEWMRMTVKYSSKAVSDMKKKKEAESKAEQEAFEENENAEKSGKTVEEATKGHHAQEAKERKSAGMPADDEDEFDADEASEYEDYHGKVIDENTIEVEMEVVEENHQAKAEAYDKLVDIANGADDAEMTTGDQGGLFDALSKVGFGRLNLLVKPSADGKFDIEITMKNEEVDLFIAQKILADISNLKQKK